MADLFNDFVLKMQGLIERFRSGSSQVIPGPPEIRFSKSPGINETARHLKITLTIRHACLTINLDGFYIGRKTDK
jgi:hypothetical protein